MGIHPRGQKIIIELRISKEFILNNQIEIVRRAWMSAGMEE
jgi:hypothetical protein